MSVPCEVPGCDRTFKTSGALGPHYGAHRRNGDAGVPEIRYPKKKAQRDRAKKAKRHLPAVREKKPASTKATEFTSRDVVEMGLLMMYPKAVVPVDDVYELTSWVQHTEAMANHAKR